MEKHQIDSLNPIFNTFSKVSLQEINDFSLQQRFDSKFALTSQQFYHIVKQISSDYSILTINNEFFTNYETVYFDTANFELYLQHHNQRSNRIKIRFRKYLNSDMSFLEIKQKSKNGLSIKKRLESSYKLNELSEKQNQFLRQAIPQNIHGELQAVLENNFTRITLISKTHKERLTFDLSLSFHGLQQSIKCHDLVIAELKQEHINGKSFFLDTLKNQYIREQNFSKYCVGIALLNSSVKKNNFKEILLKTKLWNF